MRSLALLVLFGIAQEAKNAVPSDEAQRQAEKTIRATYGVDIQGELSPYARARLDDEFRGDFMQFPVERVFLSEAARVGVGRLDRARSSPQTR